MLLNDAFVQAQAEAFATRVTREVGSQTDAQITRAFQLAVQREPTPAERKAASEFIGDQRTLSVAESHSEPDHAALISLCRSLLNINEMIYVD
jgi:hypothetical protein